MSLIASAPGKLILLGEYSVLFGGPAVVVAVNRRATVQLSSSRNERFTIRSPGLIAEPARFSLGADGTIHWSADDQSVAKKFVLVERFIETLTASDLVETASITPFEAVLDTRAFYRESQSAPIKLGIGSSAALTAAFGSAVASWAGRNDLLESPLTWLGHLLRFHREFQGGRGSGIDLAASLLGGIVEYRLDDESNIETAIHVDLPEDLHMLFVWTGRSADTGDFLKRLSGEMSLDGGISERALHRIGDVAETGVDALREGRTGSFLEAVDQFCEAMDALGEVSGLPIMSDEHRHLLRLANEQGVHYKPSGAGGGDMGVAFAADPTELSGLIPRIEAAGFRTASVLIDNKGLELANAP